MNQAKNAFRNILLHGARSAGVTKMQICANDTWLSNQYEFVQLPGMALLQGGCPK